MKKNILFKISLLFFGVIVISCFSLLAGKALAEQSLKDEIFMLKGELETFKLSSLSRVSISDPGVVDIVEADDKHLLLIAKGLGKSPIFLWDKSGKRTIMVYVVANQLPIIKDRVEELFVTAKIKGISVDINDKEGKVVLSGEVVKTEEKDYTSIIEPFKDDVLNLVHIVDKSDLVQVDLQVTELNETLQNSLGIDWSTGGISGIAPAYKETVPSSDGSISDFFKIGDFNRTGQLIAAVNALVTQGKGRVLSKPKLVVVSGKDASFLVGGQVPIRTTTTSNSGAVQENISFRDYGITMKVTPTIIKDKIDLDLNIEVSEIDASTATTISDKIAFSTRNATTHLYLDDGQPIVIAGLIKQSTSESVSRVPFISKIPVVGLLFTSKKNPVANLDQELVISLVPHRLTNREEEDKNAANAAKIITKEQPVLAVAPSIEPPAAAVVPFMEDLVSSKDIEAYVQCVQQAIAKSFSYPQEARENGWEGTVVLGLHILNDGTLAVASIAQSSGYDVFDKHALNVARKTSPYGKFPANSDLQEVDVVIPVVYSLHSN